MRISTTPLILICTILFFGAVTDALAQAPRFTVEDLTHTCGPGNPTTGGFLVRIYDGDPSMSGFTIQIQSGVTPFPGATISPIPPTFPAQPIEVVIGGLPGLAGGGAKSYLVVVADDVTTSVADNGPNFSIFNFFASTGTVTNNTSGDCTTPNGAIDVNLSGNTGVAERPIVYSWTGPAGFVDPGTQDLTGLRAGDYTLTYRDSNSPATQCVLGPITITDPAPPDYNDLMNGEACTDVALGINLQSLKKPASVTASDFVLVDTNFPGGLTPGPGLPVADGTTIGANDLADDVWFNTTAAPLDVTYTITAVACATTGNTFTVKFTINPKPTAPADTPKAICSGDDVNFNLQADAIDLGNALAGTTFEWTAADNANVTGESVGTQTSSMISDDLVNVSTGDQQVVYTVTPTSPDGCEGTPFTVTVTVNVEPVAPDIAKTICSGDGTAVDLQVDAINLGNAVAGTTFEWTVADNANVTGESTGTQTSVTISDNLFNLTPNSEAVVYTVVPTSPGGCEGEPFTVTVTVNPEPDAPDFAKTICSKDNVNVNLQTDVLDLGNALAGSTFQWVVTDNPDVTGEPVGNQLTTTIGFPLVNVSPVPQDVIIDVIPTSGLGCEGGIITLTITVDPEPVAPADTPKAICSTDNVNFDLQTDAIDLGNAIAGTTFEWTAADNTNVTGEAAGPQTTATISDVLVNTSPTAQIVVYTVTPTSPDGCEGAPFTVTVTVNVEPVAPLNTPKTICSSQDVDIDLQADAIELGNGIDNTTFEWTVADNANVDGESVGTQTTSTINDLLVNLTSGDEIVVYTITPTSPGGCVGTPFTFTVTVRPEPTAPFDTPKTICSKDNVSFNLQTGAIDLGNALANTTFSWTVADNADVTGESTGAQTTVTIGDVLVNVSSTPQAVVYTVVPTSAAGCVGAPFTVTVTVDPEPVAPVNTAKAICSTEDVDFDLQVDAIDLGNGIAGTTFEWTVVDNPNVTGESAGTQTTAMISDVLVNTSPGDQVVVYTVTPTSPDGCEGAPFTVTVTVNVEPLAPANTPKTVCSGDDVAIDLQAAIELGNGVDNTTFEWTVADNTNVTGEAVGTQTTATINDVLVNTTSGDEIVVYTITPTSPGGCVGTPFTFTVTVRPEPSAPANTPKTICSKDNVSFNLQTDAIDFGNGLAATTFSWTVADNPDVTGESTGVVATTTIGDVLVNVSGIPQPVVYTVVPTSAAGCEGQPFTVTITVNPEPVGLNPYPVTICTGDNVNLNLQSAIDLGNGVQSVTFEWTVADNTNVTGEAVGTQTTATISDVLVNTSSADQVVVYTVTPTSPDGCEGSPFVVNVTVSPRPVMPAGQGKEICGGTAVGLELLLTPANMPAGSRFKWNDPDGFLGPATSGDVAADPAGTPHINDVLTNLVAPFIDVTYVVTPYVGTCEGTPQNVVIRVYRPAVVEAGNDQTICIDHGAYQLVGSFRALSATTATWDVLSEPVPGHAQITQPSFTNPSTSTILATEPGDYVLRLTSNTPPAPSVCGPAVDLVTITVVPRPVIAPDQNPLVCANDPVNYEIQLDPAYTPANVVFNWPTPPNTGGTAGVNVPGTPGTFQITDILRNDTDSPIDVPYMVTPSVGLCVGVQEQVTVTVRPGPMLAVNQAKTICSGDGVDYEILLTPANTPPNTVFSWPDPDGAGPATSKHDVPADVAGTIHIDDVLYNGTGAPITVPYEIIAKGENGCNGVVRNVTITVNPGAIVEAGNAQAICAGGTAELTGSSFGGFATEATWSILLNPSGGDGSINPSGPTTSPATAEFTATVPGNYTLRLVTDDPDGPAGCSAVSDVVVITVRAPGDPSCTGGGSPCDNVSVQPVTTAATCSNADGAVVFNITDRITNLPAFPVSGDIEITIDGTGSTVLPSPRTNINNPEFDNLITGTYTYTIIFGDDGCVKEGTASDPLTFSIYRSGTVGEASVSDLIDPTCFGESGTATIDVPGETGNILQWSANGIDFHNFVVGNPVSGLPAGLIAVQRAGDACAAGVIIDFNMPDEIPLAVTAGEATCSGNDGTIVVAGVEDDTYVFELNGVETILPADSTFRNLLPDDYTVLVRDSKGCTREYSSIIVGQVVGPTSLDTLYVTKAISVPDLPSGSALVGVSPSGLEPYETRLELIEPLFASQAYVSDWSEVPLNPQNLKFEQSYTNLYAGVYSLGLRDLGGCTKMYVIVIDVDTQLFIPNVFTPNDDGSNDVFYIRNLPADSKLLVTNRWGKEVYKTSSYQNDWNGGDTVDGMYYYTLTLGSQSFTGWIEILRGQ